ncbi:MAG: AraC family transcriptional regulator [Clostridia bacterium]
MLILIFILFLFSAYFIYVVVSSNQETNIEKEKNNLQSVVSLIDSELEEIEVLSKEMRESQEFLSLLDEMSVQNDKYLEMSAIEKCQNLRQISDIFYECIFYLPDKNLFLDSNSSHTTDIYYESVFFVRGQSCDEFIDFVVSLSEKEQACCVVTTYHYGIVRSNLMFATKHYINNRAVYQINIIDLDMLEEKFLNDDIIIYSMVEEELLTNSFFEDDEQTDNLIKTVLAEEKSVGAVSVENETYSYNTLLERGFLFLDDFDKGFNDAQISSFIMIMSFVFIVSIFGNIVLLKRYTKKNVDPAIRLIEKISKQGIGQENKKFLSDVEMEFSYIEADNISTKKKNELYKLNEKNIFYYKLFNGKFKNVSTIKKIMQDLDINSNFDKYILFMCHYYKNEDKISDSQQVLQEIKEAFRLPEKFICSYNYDDDLICFVTSIEKYDYNYFVDISKKLIDKISEKYDFYVDIAFSTVQKDLLVINTTAEELKYLCKNKQSEFDNGVLKYKKEYFFSTKEYKFSPSQQSVIISSISQGDYETARNVINKLIEENLINTSLDVYATRLFLIQLFSVFNNLLNELKEYPDLLDEYAYISKTIFTMDELVLAQNILDLSKKLATLIKNKEIEEHGDLKNQVKQIIDAHFNEKNFDVKKLCAILEVNYNTVAIQYKNLYNNTISKVLEQKRIDEAKNLLLNMDIKISEISEKCGYSSSESFRRAFKKNVGISPSEYQIQNAK